MTHTTPELAAAIDVAIANAVAAHDHRDDTFYRDPVASYRENVIDTLSETGSSEYEAQALAAYDAKVAELRSTAAALHTLVWAILWGTDIVAIFRTFDAAHEKRADLQKVWPERTYALQPTFLYGA